MSRLTATAESAYATRGGGHSETAALRPKVTPFIAAICAHCRWDRGKGRAPRMARLRICRKRIRLGHWALLLDVQFLELAREGVAAPAEALGGVLLASAGLPQRGFDEHTLEAGVDVRENVRVTAQQALVHR